MSFTTNLDLTKVAQGAKDWHIEWGSNLDILDAVIGKIKLTDGSSGALEAGMPVYISAANTLSLADATDTTKPAVAICRTTDGTTATIRQFGVATDVLTVGSVDISAGDRIYLSTTAGKVTKTPPSAEGNVIQFLGWALTDEASGKIDLLLNINPNPVEV
jgi:hypothetical protein